MRPDVLIINYNSDYPLLLSSPFSTPSQKDRKDIRGEVSDDEVSVVVEEGLDDRDQGLRGAKHALLDSLEDCLQPGVSRDLSSTKNSIRTEVLLGRGFVGGRKVPHSGSGLLYVLSAETEDEHVVLTHAFRNLHISSVHCSFCKCEQIGMQQKQRDKERRGREEKGRGEKGEGGTNDKGTVNGELHVGGTTGLSTGSGDLLVNVGGGSDDLCR